MLKHHSFFVHFFLNTPSNISKFAALKHYLFLVIYMQKNFLFLATAALALAFATSCSVNDSNDEEYSKWIFSGTVIDSENGQGLSDVQISYQGSKGKIKTAKTDSEGNFYIKDLPFGSLNFTFNYKKVSKKDTLFYAPKILNVSSSGESSRMEGVVANTALVVRLSPLSANLSGEFYIKDESTGKDFPVVKTKLHIVHQDTEFVNLNADGFDAKTDSLGKFDFSNLPADTGLSISVEAYSYKGLRYTASNIDLPRLRSGKNDIGRLFLTRDSSITVEIPIKASNVLDKNQMGLENVSQLETPYFVFNEKINSENLSVTVTADTVDFPVIPKVKNDTLFLNHSEAFPPNAKIALKIIAYGKKSGDRIEVELVNTSAFTTSRGIFVVTSNTWPSNEDFKAAFGIEDTIWVKFSKKLSTNTDRIQWNAATGIDRTIYGNGYYTNANTWVHKDTLFIQMLEDVLTNREQGDSVGTNITVYAEDGSYANNIVLRTELIIPDDYDDDDDEE